MSLLDFLNSDDARLGIGLLAAGGPTTDPNQSGFGQRLAAGMQFADQSRQGKLREDLLRSQMAENSSQEAVRRAQLERQSRMDNYYLGGGFGGGSEQQASGSSTAAMPEGAALKAAVGAPADAPRPAQGKFAEWSKQFNIPEDALVTDYISNGGKGIADMLYKAGRPDIQVSSGYAYDKNSVKPGYLPQLNVSQDGKSTLVQIGQDGLPVVSAPRGAVNTFGDYRRTESSLKPIKVYNPDTGREEYTNEAAVAGGSPDGGAGTLGMRNNNPGNLRPPGQSTGFQQFSTPEQGLQAIDNQLRIYGQRDGINTIRGAISKWAPSNENNTGAYVDRVSKMLGVSPDAKIDLTNPYVRQALSTGILLQENGSQILTGSGGGGRTFAAGPSADEKRVSESRAQFATDVAKNDAAKLESWRSGAEAGNAMLGTAQKLREIEQQGIYSGGGAQAKTAVASMVSGLTGITPKALPGSEAFNAEASNLVLGQIKALGANPSNADRDFIMKTIPQITNSPQAREALVSFMEQKGRQSMTLYKAADAYSRQNNGLGGFDQFGVKAETPEKQSAQPKPTFDSMPSPVQFKGRRIRDTATGKVLESDGLRWKEAQ